MSCLIACSRADLELRVDPDRVRAVDLPVLLGDPGRLHAATGWEPAIDLTTTLADTLDWWRERETRTP